MSRILVCALVCLMLSGSTVHADNPLSALWPFSKKNAKPSFDRIDPFNGGGTPAKQSSMFSLPKPGKMMSGAQKQTKKALKGVQDFGKSLNPFAKRAPKPRSTSPAKGGSNWLTKMLPKKTPKQPEGPAATMSDFMKLKRPRF